MITKNEFLQGVNIACYAESSVSYDRDVCPSVCLSVRHTWHCVKTTQARITKSSPADIAQGHYSLRDKKFIQKLERFTPTEGVNCEWCRKNLQFSTNKSRISETVQDRSKVTIND